jgi:NTE family protein
MKAYVVLDGGGVKGAALAGCLKAAEEHHIEIVGYGGTSAGAIVATLAAVGYSADDLRTVLVDDIQFSSFLDDDGNALSVLRQLGARWRNPWHLLPHVKLAWRIHRDLGLYRGETMRRFLLNCIGAKLPDVKDRNDVTFEELKELGCRPLKVLATDLGSRQARVHSAAGGHEINGSVCDAVRASTSYPFVFRPVRINDRYLVDGGLCSNLPVFVFEREREQDRLPLIAFDLVQRPPDLGGNYSLGRFCGDMMATALESSDVLVRSVVKGIHHVRVVLPEKFDTLDFHLERAEALALFNLGYESARRYFSNRIPQWPQAENPVEALQALAGVPKELASRVLNAVANDFEQQTRATNIRANIMLPTPHGTRIVVYQYGMDNDADRDLELAIGAGCTGRAWMERKPNAADLVVARDVYEEEWLMTPAQQARVRADRQAMFSFPMFDLTDAKVGKVEQLPLLGVLSVDTDTTLNDTGWVTDRAGTALQIGKEWADVLSRLLT